MHASVCTLWSAVTSLVTVAATRREVRNSIVDALVSPGAYTLAAFNRDQRARSRACSNSNSSSSTGGDDLKKSTAPLSHHGSGAAQLDTCRLNSVPLVPPAPADLDLVEREVSSACRRLSAAACTRAGSLVEIRNVAAKLMRANDRGDGQGGNGGREGPTVEEWARRAGGVIAGGRDATEVAILQVEQVVLEAAQVCVCVVRPICLVCNVCVCMCVCVGVTRIVTGCNVLPIIVRSKILAQNMDQLIYEDRGSTCSLAEETYHIALNTQHHSRTNSPMYPYTSQSLHCLPAMHSPVFHQETWAQLSSTTGPLEGLDNYCSVAETLTEMLSGTLMVSIHVRLHVKGTYACASARTAHWWDEYDLCRSRGWEMDMRGIVASTPSPAGDA